MARVNTEERSLEVKLVYYGPAMGGKTTNLEALHRLVAPGGEVRLMSLDTHGDRTLFFDFLPMELADIAGFKLRVRLFTVPGQVHYNATRRIVLRGADACIFVADSSPDRAAMNRESLQGLRENLEANGVAPGSVPIVLQANKRDLEDAAPIDQMRASLGLEALQAHGRAVLTDMLPAVAASAQGVLETFERALRAGLSAVWRQQHLERTGLTRERLAQGVLEALDPIRARLAASGPSTRPARVPTGTRVPMTATEAEAVLPAEQLLAQAVERSVELAEQLGDQRDMARSLRGRVQDLETLNGLARVLASSLGVAEIQAATVTAAATALGQGQASLLMRGEDGTWRTLARSGGGAEDPMLKAGGQPLPETIHRMGRPVAYADIQRELALGDERLASLLLPSRTLAAVPLRQVSGRPAMLVAYGADPESPADANTIHFLSAIAGQAFLALQDAARRAEIEAHGAQLEDLVAERTAELRVAHAELRGLSELKDRILSCVNHELRTPVTKLLASAQVLERAPPGASPPKALLSGLIVQARHLAGLLDAVLSTQALLAPASDDAAAACEDLDASRLLEAVALACQDRAAARQVVLRVVPAAEGLAVRGSSGPLTVVLTQLVDNAVKFSASGAEVTLVAESAAEGRVRLLVRDSGQGIPPADRERIFNEFDQGSHDALVAKPAGLGLGLPIARRIARRMGGDVTVLDEPGARGATLCLELAAAPVPVGVAAR